MPHATIFMNDKTRKAKQSRHTNPVMNRGSVETSSSVPRQLSLSMKENNSWFRKDSTVVYQTKYGIGVYEENRLNKFAISASKLIRCLPCDIAV